MYAPNGLGPVRSIAAMPAQPTEFLAIQPVFRSPDQSTSATSGIGASGVARTAPGGPASTTYVSIVGVPGHEADAPNWSLGSLRRK